MDDQMDAKFPVGEVVKDNEWNARDRVCADAENRIDGPPRMVHENMLDGVADAVAASSDNAGAELREVLLKQVPCSSLKVCDSRIVLMPMSRRHHDERGGH